MGKGEVEQFSKVSAILAVKRYNGWSVQTKSHKLKISIENCHHFHTGSAVFIQLWLKKLVW